MRSAPRTRPRLPSLVALAAAAALAAPSAQAAPPTGSTLSAAPSTPPPPGVTPRASADSKRMFAVHLTSMVVWENGAGYLHGFWRTLGSQGPDSPARLQWGRGCPEVSDRAFTAIHTAFSNPGGFLLIVDKSPDARQPGAYCVTNVELERVQSPQDPPPRVASPGPAPAPPTSNPGASAPPLLTSPKK